MSLEPWILCLLAAACVGACVVHAILGFGSGPLLVPVLLLVVGPRTAVVCAVLVGMVVNVLQLAAERRRPRPPLRALGPLWLAAPPGAAGGALAAGALSADAVAAAVAVVLLGCGALLLAVPEPRVRVPGAAMALAGAATAASAALTGIFGPVLGTLLVAAGCRGDALRDGIGASFLVLGACAVAATLALAPDAAGGVPLAGVLAVPAALGHALGRRWFRRLHPAAHRRGVLLAVLVGGGVALAGTF